MDDNDSKRTQQETEAYLAKIRNTVRKSRALVESAELRLAETDRLLASQGLTREQVAAMTFTDNQVEAANAELRRRGLPELAGDGEDGPDPFADADTGIAPAVDNALRERETLTPDVSDTDGTEENRRRKFSVMMQQFRM